MPLREDPRQSMTRLEAQVRQALTAWDVSDKRSCDRCCASLETAIERLREVQSSVPQTGSAPATALAARLERLARDVRRLARLVDSAAAFGRGMQAVIGEGEALSGIDGLRAYRRLA